MPTDYDASEVTKDELSALVQEVAPYPLCVSSEAVRQLSPLLTELIQRRRAQTNDEPTR